MDDLNDITILVIIAALGFIAYLVYSISSTGNDTLCQWLNIACPPGDTPAPGSPGASVATVGNAASSLLGNAPAGGGTGGTGSVSGSFWTDTYNYFAGLPNAVAPDTFAPLPQSSPSVF